MSYAETESERKLREFSQYQLVDYGDQLLKDVDGLKNELHKQAQSLAARQQLLWDVTWAMIVLVLPVTTFLGLAIIANTFLPVILSNSACVLLMAASIGFICVNLPPLNEAVNTFLQYPPNCADCDCDKGRINKEEGSAAEGLDATGDKLDLDKDDNTLDTLNACTNANPESDPDDSDIQSFMRRSAHFSSFYSSGMEDLDSSVPGSVVNKSNASPANASGSGSSESIGVLDEGVDE